MAKITEPANLAAPSIKGQGDTVLLQGVHAVKHAWHFQAKFLAIYIAEEEKDFVIEHVIRHQLGEEDLAQFLAREAIGVPKEKIAPFLQEAATPVLGIAQKPSPTASLPSGPIIFLENPRSLHNMGGIVRTAAAAGAVAVYTSGPHNPWHASALRTAAGLHFALAAVAQTSLEEAVSIAKATNRPVFAFSAEGENIYEQSIPAHSLLIFGTEREGLSPEAKKSGTLVSLPMRSGVSSLNLAASVAAALYGGAIVPQLDL